jgi:hypothetical protein
MAPRAPSVHTHEEWKGMAQPVGLVVEPVVLNRLGVFPESATTVLADWQQRLEQLLEDQPVDEQWLSVAPSFELFCQEVLAWEPGDLRKPEELAAPVAVTLDDYDEVLHPDWVVPEASQGDGPLKAQLLVQELPAGTPFDALPKGADGRRCWEATPQQRLERLLKESEHPIGLLWNGVALRLVYAPRGESSGHLTFPLEPMITVDGRPMLAALQMLLGPDRLFEGGASNTRLRPLMEQSRKEQNEVSTRLAEQVLEALWILLRGFDAAGLKVDDPSHIYGGLITVLLRLVFLLYAEDEELMPTDSLYGQHYSVGGLAQRLRQDRTDYQNAMEGRRGAWATLLSLFRLVYDGGGPSEAYLPARHGDLFDPETYPFLEGRTANTSYSDGPLTSVPAISDDVVEQVLTKLLLLDGQILSYRALDVEQIGSVYEGIMGFMVEKATGPSVGITHKPPRQKVTITVVVDASELLAQPPGKREKWLKDATGVDLKLGDKVSKGLKTATTVEDLCHALDKRLSKHTPRGGFQSGSLILQPTAERRRSGSHYTPRSLTEPIVTEALRPWLEGCNGKPTAEQVLALKLCDPAMGSGAFLVAVCRFLARWLVAAWEDTEGPGFPPEFRKEWDKDLYARRLIAQRCLYGVDKNPFAVNLAKLSLWLVTLSKELPFTFVDHALKCGDSLVGYSLEEIQAATKNVQLLLLKEHRGSYVQACSELRRSFAEDTRSDKAYDHKRVLLQQQIKATEKLRHAGDLMVAAFFDAPKAKDRTEKEQVYLAMLSGGFEDEGLQDAIQGIRAGLFAGDKGITPFHWDLEFPEVFGDDRNGFDALIGNPPFIGGSKLSALLGENYPAWLRYKFTESGGKGVDISAHFYRQAQVITRRLGTYSLIATKTIAEGDTRVAGLAYLIGQGDVIYACKKQFEWPGVASVIVSVVHLRRNARDIEMACVFNDSSAEGINSHLIPSPHELNPSKLSSNKERSFLGCKIYGEGFIFSNSGTPEKEDYAGGSRDLSRILEEEPRCREVIYDYIGGKEITTHPSHKGYRQVINFKQLSLDEVRARYAPLVRIVEERVKPKRDEMGCYQVAERRKQLWWQFGTYTPRYFELIDESGFVLAMSRTTAYIAIAKMPARTVFSEKAVVFAPWRTIGMVFALLQSRLHEHWALTFGLTQGETPVYKPPSCFETFPFAPGLGPLCDIEGEMASALENAGNRYLEHRAIVMLSSNEGLTKIYNRFHDPAETDDQIMNLRRLHGAMDGAVLASYGWNDVLTACGFGLDSVDLAGDIQLSEELQERIASDEIFFWDVNEALDFQSQLQAHGVITGRSKLPWRYRWPDAVRDDVLARLLALNAQRHAEEQALGAQSNRASRRPSRTKRTSNEFVSPFPMPGEIQVDLFQPQTEQLELGR